MKLRRFLAVLLVLVLMLAGCGAEEMIDDSVIRADAELLLAAFVNDDYDACRGIVDASVADADLQAIFPSIAAELADLGEYEMTAVASSKKVSGDQEQVSVQYLVSGESGKYYLYVGAIEGQDGLGGFQIAEAEADAEPATPEGLPHRMVSVVGIVTLCFSAWMVIDCIKRKMKRKWLWIPLIVLGAVVLTFVMHDGGLTFRYSIGLYMGLTSLTTFTTGGFRLNLYVPIAAIVYFFKRKELTTKEETVVQIVEEAE